MDQYYNGWHITYNPNLPITGQWRAERFGVGMCNNSLESIKRTILNKIEQARIEKGQK